MKLKPRSEAFNIAHNPMRNYWEGQQAAVASIFGAIHDGYKVIALNAGTGTGKSVMLAAQGNLMGDSHILTSQKKLQEQYLELGSNFKRVLGRSNFTCKHDCSVTCDKGTCVTTGDDTFKCPYKPAKSGPREAFADKFWTSTNTDDHCPYWKNVEIAWHAQHKVFNYAYYVLKMNNDYNEFEKASVQLLDEAHNLEDNVRSMSAFEITDRIMAHVRYNPGIDTFRDGKFERVEKQINNKHSATDWLVQLEERVDMRLTDTLDAKKNGSKDDDIQRRILNLEGLLNRLRVLNDRFKSNPDNWVFSKSDYGFKLTPLFIGDYLHGTVLRHADVSIFASATLPPKKMLCERLGLKEDEVFYYTMPSPFDPDNAPIFMYSKPVMKYDPSGMDHIRNVMGGAIKSVMGEYKGQRGLILCNSFAEVMHYRDFIRNKFPEDYHRLTVHRKGDNVEDLLREHASKPDSVIISPSMWEGLDLKGDLGEFLIIAKVPYPDMSDPVVKGLMAMDKKIYYENTVLKIMQGVGRVIRSAEDEADIHILDGAFVQLFRYNKRQFTEEFIERVIRV